MKPVLSVLGAAVLLSVSAWAAAQNLAIVNGKPVPSSRAKALVQQLERSGRPVDASMMGQVKDEVIMREIFMQEAIKRGVPQSANYKDQMELARQSILIRELFNDHQTKNPVTDAQIKAEYDKYVAANAGQEYRARHILVADEARAKALIASLKAGAKFEELATKESMDKGSGANGGDLDWASANTFVPEFSGAMVKLQKGQLTDAPVQSQFGWHIIRLDDVRAAQLPSFEEVKGELGQQLQQQRLSEYQNQLRAKAKIQ
jgi:peptidyl-prolyl cis-trans isomerase C